LQQTQDRQKLGK